MMNRRDLLRALAAGLLLPLQRPRRRRRPRPPRPPWSFRLGSDLTWTLAARDGRTVVGGAEIAAALGGAAPRPLAALERVRRIELSDPRGGRSGWQIVGQLDGVEISAQFLDGPPPQITVSARGLTDPQSLEEIRFFDTWRADVPALGSRPAAWINGYLGSDPCGVTVLGGDADVTSHWQLAVLPGASRRPTAFSFGADDAGEGRFDCAKGRVVAASRLTGRSVGAALPPAVVTLAIEPADDPLDMLARLVRPLPTPAAPVPAGWGPALGAGDAASEERILADLDAARAVLPASAPRVLRMDDGYQRAAGDWETNDRFEHGHRWLTDRIHAAGFQAGLWLAPLLAGEGSGIPSAHPEWLLKTPEGEPLVVTERASWGGKVYALDAAQVAVRDYLRDLARHAAMEWGYDALTFDVLHHAAAGVHEGRGMSGAEACRAAIRALREGSASAFVTAVDAPLQTAAGLVDAMRIVPAEGAGFDALHRAAEAVALRVHFHGRAWLDEAGPLALGEPLTLDEARLWATVMAFSGGPAFLAGAVGSLAPDRLEVLARTMPVAQLDRRAFDDRAPDRSGDAPAWMLGRVREGWWMLAALNWGDDPRRVAVSLADHGVRGPQFVYDVWEDRRRPDVDGRIALRLAPRTAAVLSLKARRRGPAVIGSTRHVIQGVDVTEEYWDAGNRTLTARAVHLDGRPYAATVALPAGARPKRAATEPDAGAAFAIAGSGAERVARLVIEKPPAEEFDWELDF